MFKSFLIKNFKQTQGSTERLYFHRGTKNRVYCVICYYSTILHVVNPGNRYMFFASLLLVDTIRVYITRKGLNRSSIDIFNNHTQKVSENCNKNDVQQKNY